MEGFDKCYNCLMYTIFKGVKVLDLTKVLSGPLATRYLADYGAEVIKIESKSHPDPARKFPPLKTNWSGYFEVFNRNKQSLEPDMSTKKGLNAFYSLVKEADVVVENMRPSAKFKLKVDYETLRQIQPTLIYASLAGIDQKTDKKYFDVIAQAESGMMSLTGIDEPTKIGPAVVDAYAGLTLAFGIASALFKRERTGKGSSISVSMLASAINLLEHNLIESSITKQNPVLPGNHDNAIAPFGIYKTKDGRVVIAIGTDTQWEAFANYYNLQSKKYRTNAMRLSAGDDLTFLIEQVFANASTKMIINNLHKLHIPCAKVQTMQDVLNNKWMYESGALSRNKSFTTTGYSLHFENEAKKATIKAPALGQHNKKHEL